MLLSNLRISLTGILRIAIDPIFPPPTFYHNKKLPYENILETNKFELIFDEATEGQ